MGARFSGTIKIGDNSIIGRNCILIGNITIKNNVSITAETYIFTTSHIINSPTFACFYKEVIIDDYAWIGARAMILPGIKIGRGSVVGAASTVTKDVPDNSIVAGAPAREIGKRTLIPEYTLMYSPFFQ
jgi:maltose O-acetyltransferase